MDEKELTVQRALMNKITGYKIVQTTYTYDTTDSSYPDSIEEDLDIFLSLETAQAFLADIEKKTKDVIFNEAIVPDRNASGYGAGFSREAFADFPEIIWNAAKTSLTIKYHRKYNFKKDLEEAKASQEDYTIEEVQIIT